ncbi:MAG TPA: ABC transporter ATP-binding protein [Spirochaetes bacterium]|nr:ABC transporter ATP-binding protein [Spirochaetota bacterium]
MNSSNSDCVIQIQQVKTRLGDRWVHKDVNLEILKGETMLVIGGSGSGKSVLFKNIVGLLKPNDGSIRIDGVDITKISDRQMDQVRKKFGVLFQGAALFDSLTVQENVAFVLKRETDLSDKAIRDVVRDKLAQVGLFGVEEMMPSELSGGMQKRVGLARAIAMNPEIILYDEPTTGLDPITADVINDLILQLQEELKVTSLVVTHDMVSAFKVGDRMALLNDGRIIAVGTPDEMRESEDPYVRQFIAGTSEGPMFFE